MYSEGLRQYQAALEEVCAARPIFVPDKIGISTLTWRSDAALKPAGTYSRRLLEELPDIRGWFFLNSN